MRHKPGLVYLPVLVMIIAVSVFSSFAYFAVRTYQSKSEMDNSTVSTNTAAVPVIPSNTTVTFTGAPDFGGLIKPYVRPVITDVTTHPATDWPYQSTLLSSLSNTFPVLQGVSLRAIAFRGDQALIGGEKKSLFLYDGSTLKDLSSLISGDTQEEKTNMWPRVETILATPDYWLIDVYGSNVDRIYKYDGKTATKVAFPTQSASSGVIESGVWTGKTLLIGDLMGRLYSFNGTEFTAILDTVINPISAAPPTIGWNGINALIYFPSQPHHTYSLIDTKLTEVADPDVNGITDNPPALSAIGWDGKKWLAGGQKLWSFDGHTWTEMKDIESQFTKSPASIIEMTWTGTYWLISTLDDIYKLEDTKLTNITSDFSQVGLSRWISPIRFSTSYGLATTGGGGLTGLIRIEKKSSLTTVNSDTPFACYTPEQLATVPSLGKTLTTAGFNDRTFTDLCIATNSNPQKRFYVLRPTTEQYDYSKKKNIPCTNCYRLQGFSLPNGTNLQTENLEQIYPFVIGASVCAFDGVRPANTKMYQSAALLINCVTKPSSDQYQYYQRYGIPLTSSNGADAIFEGQCSVWDTDLANLAKDGEEDTALHYEKTQAVVRCGNPKQIPLQSFWATYDTDGFSFQYPKTWFLDSLLDGDQRLFQLHPRNLGSGEGGGGPWNSYTLKLLPAKTQAQVLVQVQADHKSNNDSEAKLEKKTINGQPAVVYTPGPGMCGGEEIYLIGTTHMVYYSTYCANWQNIDQTFRIK